MTPKYRRRGIARRLVAEISSALFAKGAERLSALVEHEHPWAIKFWDSLRDLDYERDPKFVRYIADHRQRKAHNACALKPLAREIFLKRQLKEKRGG
jgi:ribosomal protein S18 acetylase RimI-like enzyme